MVVEVHSAVLAYLLETPAPLVSLRMTIVDDNVVVEVHSAVLAYLLETPAPLVALRMTVVDDKVLECPADRMANV